MKKKLWVISLIILIFSFSIIYVKGDNEIITLKLQKNNKTAYINDVPIELDAAPIEIPPGRIMVPIRFISEAFGAKVFWDQKTESVSIYMDSVLYYKNKSAILEQKINTLQDENDNLRKQIEELNYEKNNMVIQNNILQNKVFELDKENNTLKEQINILNKKLEEYQNKYSNRETGNDIFENNKFKIVSIENYDNKGNLKGRGTGFVATDNGKVITNFHVIENANYVIVKFMDDRNYKINGLINYDINRDLAILKLPIDLIEPIKIGDSDKIKVGDEIILISNPLGLNLTLTNGVISYVNRIINNQTFIQYTAPSSPGSSGGPLFNLNGEVIGVVNSKIVLEGVEGINFAIPINDVKLLLKEEKPIEFNKIFSQSYSSWDLSDDKILEAINLGKKYYNDTIKLIEMFSIYSISYSLITTKTNVTVMTPYFWIAYNTAENMKSGKDITIKDAYSFLKNYGNQLDFLLLIYGNSIDFYKYYSVKLYISINEKILFPFDSIISSKTETTIYYPKTPKYYAFNFYTFLNTEIPRNAKVTLLIDNGFGKEESIDIDLSKFQ